jgi:hypothetical protein
MASRTLAVNAGLMMPLLLMTAETVEVETFASLATSCIVLILCFAMFVSYPLPFMETISDPSQFLAMVKAELVSQPSYGCKSTALNPLPC